VVIGIGLNVRHAAGDFPDELRGSATSLVLEGSDATLEDAAAEVLRRLEPVWNELQSRDRAVLLAEWSRWCTHWGRPLTVRTPAGSVSGTALRVDADGGLVLRTEAGAEVTVVAGDVLASPEGSDAR
jgi:BirA family biotin operon repressor/biotin-[acetyl-CoA-carboxylase] ligase